MRSVIIVGMYAPFEADPGGAEIWACNAAFGRQSNATRIYHLDPLYPGRGKEFVDAVNALGVPFVCQRYEPDIPKSEPYPLLDVLRFFYGEGTREALLRRAYFTSTIAYMLADAIRQGFDRIVLHRLLVAIGSDEYMLQKPCLDFWCGQAMGRGIQLSISDDSSLCKPFPWESGLYGFEENPNFAMVNNTITSAFRVAYMVPVAKQPCVNAVLP